MPRSVLVIDDEPVLLALATALLGGEGFDVTVAATAEAALTQIAQKEFGVILVDKNLPGDLDGVALMSRARGRWPLTRWIIITGYPSKESTLRALKEGAFDYLEKPIDNDALVQQVRRAWDSYATALERGELFQKYETLFEIVPGIVWFMTENGVIKRVNREGAAMLGYGPEELVGATYTALLPPDRAGPAAHWAFKERRTGRRATRGQVVELRTRAGATKLFEICSTGAYDGVPGKPGARFWGTLGVGWDITEHAVLEEQLQQARKMEAIGRLAGGVAHDFNNLLSVILNNAEFVTAGMPETDPRRADVAEIELCARRGAELTRQLLTFSRKQVLSARPTDLRHVVREIEPLLRRLIGENIEVIFDQPDRLGTVNADPSQMEQVILNLAVNARDAMVNGGRLTLQTRDVVLDAEFAASHLGVKPGAYVMLCVSDTGVGLAPEVRDHLFEPFFTTKGAGRGTGLGLATVYGIVMQSDGHISIYSEADTGTSVKVYLPVCAPPEPTDAIAVEPVSLPTGNEVVLVVEDEVMVRNLARRILERAGYRVLVAENGEVALATAAAAEHIDLLLTDMVMPKMNGAEVAQKLRALSASLRVVYMSGYVGNVTTQHPMLADGAAFLQKPFTAAGLLQLVRSTLDAPFSGPS
jgi:PAS domain S-box-containing protein